MTAGAATAAPAVPFPKEDTDVMAISQPVPVHQLKLMSPSGVGRFALCPKRLVHEADHPEWDSPPWPATDLGTVCHYFTQAMLGIAPPKAPTMAQFLNAREAKRFRKPDVKLLPLHTKGDQLDDMDLAVNDLCAAAVAALPTLPEGARWVSEYKASLPGLLPARIGKDGNRGFSGSLDLMISDRSHIIDLKFPGDPVTVVKYEYIAQMASYSIITDVMKTSLIFIPVNSWVKLDAETKLPVRLYDANQKIISKATDLSMLTIDWSPPHMRELRDSFRGFISWTDDCAYRNHAWFIPSKEACEYCDRNPKKWKRQTNCEICPMHLLPEVQHLEAGSNAPAPTGPDIAPGMDESFMKEMSEAAARQTGADALSQAVSPEQRAALIPTTPQGLNLG